MQRKIGLLFRYFLWVIKHLKTKHLSKRMLFWRTIVVLLSYLYLKWYNSTFDAKYLWPACNESMSHVANGNPAVSVDVSLPYFLNSVAGKSHSILLNGMTPDTVVVQWPVCGSDNGGIFIRFPACIFLLCKSSWPVLWLIQFLTRSGGFYSRGKAAGTLAQFYIWFCCRFVGTLKWCFVKDRDCNDVIPVCVLLFWGLLFEMSEACWHYVAAA